MIVARLESEEALKKKEFEYPGISTAWVCFALFLAGPEGWQPRMIPFASSFAPLIESKVRTCSDVLVPFSLYDTQNIDAVFETGL